MKRRKWASLLNVLLYTGLVGIGIIVGIAIRHYSKLSLNETLNIVDLATLVTTIFLAVYIPEVLDRKLQVTRDKKELLEKHILEYQALLRRANMLVQGDAKMTENDFLMLHNSLEVATSKLESLGKLLLYSKLNDTFQQEISAIKKIDSEHSSLLATPGNKPLVSYPVDVCVKESDLYNLLDEKTTLLIFKISDAK